MTPSFARALAVSILVSAGGCAHLLGPRPVSDWEPAVAAQVSSAAITIDGGSFLGFSEWIAHGVIVHSSRERGTFALTNEHVARGLADTGGVARVTDLVTGEVELFPVEPVAPDTAALTSTARALEAAGDDSDREFLTWSLTFHLKRMASDVALVRVVTEPGRVLTSARLGASRVESARPPIRAVPIYPERDPFVIELTEAPSGTFARATRSAVQGTSGSGIFDADGRVRGLIAWCVDSDMPAAQRAKLGIPEGEGVGLTRLEEIVAWLRENRLAWVTSGDPELELAAVERAEKARDVQALDLMLREPDRVHHDLRPLAVAALGRLGRLPPERAEALVRGDRDPDVRAAAVRALARRSVARADELALVLVAGSYREASAMIAALDDPTAPSLPRTIAALRGSLQTGDTADPRRANAATLLVRRGLVPLADLPASLAETVVARLLAWPIDFAADSGPFAEVCRRAGARVGVEVQLHEELAAHANVPVTMAAGRSTLARRLESLGLGAKELPVLKVKPERTGVVISSRF